MSWRPTNELRFMNRLEACSRSIEGFEALMYRKVLQQRWKKRMPDGIRYEWRDVPEVVE